MALGERFTHVSDTVLYYPRKHKSSVLSLELTDNSWLLVRKGAQVSLRFVILGEWATKETLSPRFCLEIQRKLSIRTERKRMTLQFGHLSLS